MKNKKVFLLSLGVLLPATMVAKKAEKPNVIFIYADDLGKGMLSAYGQQQFTTPNIDRLVRKGIAFENAYGCMLSAPARASLLTGYHDCHADKWNISGGGRYVLDLQDTAKIAPIEEQLNAKEVRLPQGDLYLPQVFQEAGYTTVAIGKLEWGFTATRRQMRNHGWDSYYGYLDHVRCHGFYPNFLFDDGQIIPIAGNTRKNGGKSLENETEQTLKERWNREGKEVYAEDLFMQRALRYLNEHQAEPFFMYYASTLPHGPVAIPVIHPEVAGNSHLTTLEKEYASMVKRLDETVGQLMAEVERLGMAERTLFVFSADNGHEIYYSQRGRCEKPYRNLQTGQLFNNWDDKYYSRLSGDVFNGNAGMAGLKRSNLEGGIHVPLAFYGKGIVPSGKQSERYVSNYDFLVTMADWLHVALPVKKDGESYLSVLRGKDRQPTRYLVFGSNEGPAILSSDGWKLRYHLKRNNYELFYLPADPRETTDLKEQNRAKAKELKTLLLKECDGNLQQGVNRAG